MYRAAVAGGIAALAVALGIVAVDTARDDPGYWFTGTSAADAVALLAAGWGLVAAGIVLWRQRPESACGLLLAAAGLTWFVPELNNPGVGSSIAFTAGLVLAAATPALVGHALLAYPGGRLGSTVERATVALAYGGAVLLLGLLPALLSDPRAQGCSQCPRNLVLLAGRPSSADDVTRVGLFIGLAWAVALTVLTILRIVRAARGALPVFAAGAVYLALAAATFAAWIDHGYLSTGALEHRFWVGEAISLVGIALALVWSWVRARRARASVARLVVDLAQSPPPGGLRDVLAGIVGDPELLLAYPVATGGRLVDAHGRPIDLPAGRERTSLVRDGRTVAVLANAPGLLHDEQLVEEVTAAARLALENERLQAEIGARVEEVRASRTRIVAAGDAERERLERDLHDGAQQRLVGLSISLRLVRSRLEQAPQLEAADEELRLAIAELRDLAHGLFPAVLADEGLAAAVEALTEDGPVPIRIREIPEERFPAPVESAAYTVVAEAARTAPGGLTVSVEHKGGSLTLDVETPALDGLDVLGLRDRVGALDGRLEITARNGHATIHVELPCGS